MVIEGMVVVLRRGPSPLFQVRSLILGQGGRFLTDTHTRALCVHFPADDAAVEEPQSRMYRVSLLRRATASEIAAGGVIEYPEIEVPSTLDSRPETLGAVVNGQPRFLQRRARLNKKKATGRALARLHTLAIKLGVPAREPDDVLLGMPAPGGDLRYDIFEVIERAIERIDAGIAARQLSDDDA